MNDNAVNPIEVRLRELFPIIKEKLLSGGEVKFKPHGVSMLPLIRQGKDSVSIAPLTNEPKKNDVIFYQRPDGQFVLHRIAGRDKDGFILCGDNQLTLEHSVKKQWIIGIMTAVHRDGRTCSVDSFRYLIYLRVRLPLWKMGLRLRIFLRKLKNKL